jgi:hypothetical protein
MKPRLMTVLCAAAMLLIAVPPALAWWQFVALGPNGERKVYTRYATEKRCQAALEAVKAKLKKKRPEQFPLVGSCEEYR